MLLARGTSACVFVQWIRRQLVGGCIAEETQWPAAKSVPGGVGQGLPKHWAGEVTVRAERVNCALFPAGQPSRHLIVRLSMLDYVALFMLVFVVVTLFYGIIAIHDIPYEIAKHRNHPHQDAIHATGWVSLLTLHVLWPFLWIWATLYRPDRGWGFSDGGTPAEHIKRLEAQVAALSERLDSIDGLPDDETTQSPDEEAR